MGKRKTDRPLTPKEEAFAKAMLSAANASEAYRSVYNASRMQPQTVWVKASQLLAKDKVAVRLAGLRNQVAEKSAIELSTVVKETGRLGLSDPALLFDEKTGDLKHIKDLPPEIRACIASVEIEQKTKRDPGDPESFITYTVKKLKLWDKNSALVSLMKHLGGYAEDNKQKTGADELLQLLREGRERSAKA